MILLKIHWPARIKKGSVGIKPENLLPVDIPSTWKAMEALYDSGKARAIGVSNFSTKKLADLLELARVPPAVNQVECHPSWRQTKLQEFCKSKGVHLSVSITRLTNPFTFYFIHSLNDFFFPGILAIRFSRDNMAEERCFEEPDTEYGCGKTRKESCASRPSLGTPNGSQCASQEYK